MKSIVEEKLVSFKELEQKIFKYICELGQEITQTMLESYDEDLAASRDTKQYRDKGKRKTTIKTVYVEAEYRRRIYQITMEDGRKAYVYLLDKEMQMDKDRTDINESGREDCNDSDKSTLSGHGR